MCVCVCLVCVVRLGCVVMVFGVLFVQFLFYITIIDFQFRLYITILLSIPSIPLVLSIPSIPSIPILRHVSQKCRVDSQNYTENSGLLKTKCRDLVWVTTWSHREVSQKCRVDSGSEPWLDAKCQDPSLSATPAPAPRSDHNRNFRRVNLKIF